MFDINENDVSLIEQCFGNILEEMLKRKLNAKHCEAYSDVIRSFTTTLQFYSAKAYNFVCSSFHQALPRQSTLRKWCASVSRQPGFIAEAFGVTLCSYHFTYKGSQMLLFCSVINKQKIYSGLGRVRSEQCMRYFIIFHCNFTRPTYCVLNAIIMP